MNKENLVLLHGWGFNRFIWDPILPELNRHFETFPLDIDWQKPLNTLCEEIAEKIPEKSIFLGWSLGGVVALAMAQQFPERVSKIISVCSSPKFIKSENWPGIEARQLDIFAQQFQADPSDWLRKFTHSQLGSLDLSTLNLARFFEKNPPSEKTLNAGLSLLKNADYRAALAELAQEKLFIFGRLDRITLESTSLALQHIPRLSYNTIKRAAHIPFLSHPDIFLKHIRDFCEKSKSNRKQQIKNSFNKAAESYHDAALLQKSCAEQLLEKLPKDFSPKRILELGSGTGHLTEGLLEKFPLAEITAIDLAENMLRKSKAFKTDRLHLFCADAESLPFQNESFDLIISNFTLQWCELAATFRECERVLNKKGRFYFCTLGENTLKEVKAAWRQLDHERPVNEFPSTGRILAILQEQFQTPTLTDIERKEYHEHPLNLIMQIKAWGAQTIHTSHKKGLCGKNKFKQFIEFYQNHFQEDHRVYASYHTLYGSAHKN